MSQLYRLIRLRHLCNNSTTFVVLVILYRTILRCVMQRLEAFLLFVIFILNFYFNVFTCMSFNVTEESTRYSSRNVWCPPRFCIVPIIVNANSFG